MLRLKRKYQGRALIPILIGLGVLLLIVGIVGLVWVVKSFSEAVEEGFAAPNRGHFSEDEYLMKEDFAKGFARIELSPTNTLWLEFDKKKVRSASSKEALADQEWVQFEYNEEFEQWFSPMIELSLLGGKFQGWEAISVRFSTYEGDSLVADWYLSLTDDQGTRWRYAIASSIYWLGEAGQAVPRLDIPDAKYPAFMVSGECGYDRESSRSRKTGTPTIRVSVYLGFDRDACWEVLRDNEPVKIKVRLTDDAGNILASKERVFSDFDPIEGSCYLEAPKAGTYTLQASIDTGPLNGVMQDNIFITSRDWLYTDEYAVPY